MKTNHPPSAAIPSARWRKSSHSGGASGQCVEAAGYRQAVAVRDSKDPAGPWLSFSAAAWRSFTDQVKGGTLDLG